MYEEEKYQAFRVIVAGPRYDPSMRAWQCWFHVTPLEVEWDDPFTFGITVTDLHAGRSADGRSGVSLALDGGSAWRLGLIDLGRIRQGVLETQVRTTEWAPFFSEGDLSEDELRRELLTALRRQNLAVEVNSSAVGIDVDGMAAVLGVRPQTLRGVVSELIVEGLAEPYADTFGKTASSGRCRITAEGLRLVREARSLRTVSVDAIESFSEVRNVSPQQVADLLDNQGVFRAPEAKVKDVLLQIIGEPYADKDWGGERSDAFSTRLLFEGQRVPVAMLLKGPAVGPVLYPAGLGRRGDQDQRLFTEPAEVFVVQFVGKIESTVYQWMRTQATVRALSGARTVLCVIDGVDTARIFRAYGFA